MEGFQSNVEKELDRCLGLNAVPAARYVLDYLPDRLVPTGQKRPASSPPQSRLQKKPY